MQKYRIGILQINPQTLWRPGGGEVHADKYVEYGNKEEFIVERFNQATPFAYDLIHFFGSAYQMNEFGKYAALEGIKVVGTPILFPSDNAFKYRAFLKMTQWLPFPTTLQLRRDLLRSADILIGNSGPESAYFSEAYGISPLKVVTLGTGVDADFLQYHFSVSDLPKELEQVHDYVLMVGRVTPLKNQLAVAKLMAERGVPLVLVGKPDLAFPEYISSLKKMVAQYSHIRWIEGLPFGSPALKAIYSRAACHLLWSDTEVAALVNLEAAALGCPVVTRNHPTSLDIMKNIALYARDERQLMDHIERILEWPASSRSGYEEKAQKFIAQKHTWQAVVDESLNIYRKLLSDKTA